LTPPRPDSPERSEQAQEWLAGLALGDLSAEEQESLEQILGGPAAAAEQQAVYLELLQELQALPAGELSPGMEARLAVQARTQMAPQHPLKRLMLIAVAGMAAAAAAIAWQLKPMQMQMAQQAQPPAIAEAPTAKPPAPAAVPRNQFLLTSATIPGAEAKVTLRPNKPTNLLEVKGLKPLPPGQTYRLWALTPDGQQGCASFQTDAQGNVRIQVPREPSGSAVSLLISVDPVQPGSAPTQPAKPVLMSI